MRPEVAIIVVPEAYAQYGRTTVDGALVLFGRSVQVEADFWTNCTVTGVCGLHTIVGKPNFKQHSPFRHSQSEPH